jgi:hypothetical protein
MSRSAEARWLRLLYRSYTAAGHSPAAARALARADFNAITPF